MGFDYAETMLDGARRRFAGRPNIRLLKADVARLEFPSDSFDSINCAHAVHAFPGVDAGLCELRRVLKPGARLALNVLLFPRGLAPLCTLARRVDDWCMRKGILTTPYLRADIEQRVRAAGLEILDSWVSGNTLMLTARKPL